MSSLRTSHSLQLQRAPFARFKIIEEHVDLHMRQALLNHIALGALLTHQCLRSALYLSKMMTPVRPKGVAAFSIRESAAQFAPTFAKQCRVELFGRNIAGAEVGDRTRP